MLAFRGAVALSCSTISADGDQYLSLATELRRARAFAFSESPREPSWVRPPVYPAVLAVLGAGTVPEQTMYTRAALFNALADAGTALAILVLAGTLGLRPAVQLLAVLLFALAPLSFRFTSVVLTESLATCLGAACLALAFRYRSFSGLAAAGTLCGLACLTRADMLTVLPALLVAALSLHGRSWRSLRPMLVALVFTALPLSLWAGRNLVRFDRAHLFGAEWSEAYGTPLSPCLPAWFRTWAIGRPNDSDLAGAMYWSHQRKTGYLYPWMTDSDEERAELEQLNLLLERRPPSDRFEEFCSLAARRRAAHPVRYYLLLPLQRIAHMFAPIRLRDHLQTISWLGLPAHDRIWWRFSSLGWLLSALGLLSWRRGIAPGRARTCVLLAILVCCASRIVLHAFAVPHIASGRFLVELLPFSSLFAALGVMALARRGAALSSRARSWWTVRRGRARAIVTGSVTESATVDGDG